MSILPSVPVRLPFLISLILVVLSAGATSLAAAVIDEGGAGGGVGEDVDAPAKGGKPGKPGKGEAREQQTSLGKASFGSVSFAVTLVGPAVVGQEATLLFSPAGTVPEGAEVHGWIGLETGKFQKGQAAPQMVNGVAQSTWQMDLTIGKVLPPGSKLWLEFIDPAVKGPAKKASLAIQLTQQARR